MSEDETQASLMHLFQGSANPKTDWGIANAITRTAEDAKTMSTATRLEKSGWEVVQRGTDSIRSSKRTITVEA